MDNDPKTIARNTRRPSVYLRPPLLKLQESLQGMSLSARLSQIAERYQLLCKASVDIGDQEEELLKTLLEPVEITPVLIRHLEDELWHLGYSHGIEDQSQIGRLVERISELDDAERIALIERIGL